MACGTPVLAFRCGSIPRGHRRWRYRQSDEEEAVAALPAILSYDRRAVRQRFEERFSATRMAKDYVSTYRQLLRMRTSNRRRRSPWLRGSGLNGGNESIPVSPKRPFPLLAQPGANFEVDPIRMRAIDLSTVVPSRDPRRRELTKTLRAFLRSAEKCLILSEAAI